MVITADQTYILAGYTVQCEGIVTTWEFCYQSQSALLGAPSATFYPSIWGTSGDNTTYSLIQSSTVTFDPRFGILATFLCQNYTLPVTEQFTAPSGSVVGLYNPRVMQSRLLHTNTDDLLTTYRLASNQSIVVGGSANDVNYNIAIRVHLGKFVVLLFLCVPP